MNALFLILGVLLGGVLAGVPGVLDLIEDHNQRQEGSR